jgi:hypothetical protein
MNARLILSLLAAMLFGIAGFVAMTETSGSGQLRLTYLWVGLAMAALSVAIGLSDRGRRNPY